MISVLNKQAVLLIGGIIEDYWAQLWNCCVWPAMQAAQLNQQKSLYEAVFDQHLSAAGTYLPHPLRVSINQSIN